jgi:hypothetical protein
MNTNRAFLKSMRFLSRPVIPLLLVVMLFNDHLLRRLWPSWWTGKLSDFVWLFITPVIVSAGLAWLIPAKAKRQEKITGLLAYSLTAVAFTQLKTILPLRDSFLRLWQSSLSIPVALVIDPTDLLALLVLPLSALMWFRAESSPLRIPQRSWLILPLFSLLTVANMAAPNYGIVCLDRQADQLIASSGYASFASKDGGLTWNDYEYRNNACFSPQNDAPIQVSLPDAQLRSFAGSRVEISRDGGSTWQTEYKLTNAREALYAYYEKNASGNPVFRPGPLDALYDPASGNVLFAMGRQGVLVRNPDAIYNWVSAGNYRPLDLSNPDAFLTVLGGEMALSGGFMLLLLATWALAIQKPRWPLKVFIIGAWLVWGINAFIFSPARATGYGIQMSLLALLVMIAMAIPVGIYGIIIFLRQSARRVILMAVGSGLVFLLPYILWYINAIPYYVIASVTAAVIAIIWGVVGSRQAGRWAV